MGLQPIRGDPKDNGVAAMLDGRHTVLFLNLQGLVANHLLVKLHKHTHITSFLYFCLCLKVCNWNWDIYKSLLQIYTVLHNFSYVHNNSKYRSQADV